MPSLQNGEQVDFKGKFAEEWTRVKNETKKISFLVMGGSGTGKSTLVNLV